MAFEICDARDTDIPAVAEIENGSFTDPWPESSFRQLFRDPRTTFLIARDADVPVAGYALATQVGDEAEILNLAVVPSSRNCGIGGRVLDELLARLTAAGIRQIFLEVRESNAFARKLYTSREFAEISSRRDYYRRPVESAVVMRKQSSARSQPPTENLL